MNVKLSVSAGLMGATFKAQRNSDIFSSNDPGEHFKNRYSSHICFVENGTGQPDPAGSGGQPSPQSNPQGGGQPQGSQNMPTQEQMTQLMQMMGMGGQPQSQPPAQSDQFTQMMQLMQMMNGNNQPAQNQPPVQNDQFTQMLQMMQMAQMMGGNQPVQQPVNTAFGPAQMMQFMQVMGGGNNLNNQSDSTGVFAKIQQAFKEQQDQQSQQRSIESIAQFDAAFDGFIKENQRFFADGLTADKVRAGVDEWAKDKSLDEKTQGMAAAAAKSFFSKAENLKALDEADRKLAQEKIVNINERNIDRDVVWPLISRAIFNLKRLEEAGQYRSNSQNNKATGFKAVDAYNNRFFPKQEDKK